MSITSEVIAPVIDWDIVTVFQLVAPRQSRDSLLLVLLDKNLEATERVAPLSADDIQRPAGSLQS